MFLFGLFPPIFWVLFVGYVALWYRVFVQWRGGYWLFRDYGWLTALIGPQYSTHTFKCGIEV